LPPVKDHPHTEANSVIGGPVYRGSKLPDLVGSFVYGDYITGTIWAIRPDKEGAYSHRTLVDTDQRIVAFTEGTRGELFVLDYDLTGQIYELVPSNLEDTTATFPRRLSETGLFQSLETMTPAAGIVPYTVLVEPWMDGAKAERWVAIPGAGKIDRPAAVSQPAIFPEGTVLVKHLTLEQADGAAIRLETQLLHNEHGVWHPYSYAWDDGGREALLVDSAGENRPLRLTDPSATSGMLERTWHINATNECKLCHNAAPRFVLGFVPNQLSRPAAGDLAATNQLAALAAQGVLTSAPAIASDDPLRLVDPRDSRQSLDDRARSYLHANCSMCHHPGGNAIVSFFLRRDLPFDKLNTNKGTGIGTFGIREAKIIAPGQPTRSLLLYRMAKLGYARMPYIGSQVVDGFGIDLISQWIGSLPRNSAASSPSVVAASDVNSQSLRNLLTTTEGALALVTQAHRGALNRQDFEQMIALGGGAATSDVRGLFETFIPESQRRPTLGANIDPQTILSRQGDRERGKLIFFSDGARCRACHEIDEPAKSLGPTLQEINKKYAQPAEFLLHVLQPSLKVDEPYAAYAVLTDDGRMPNGLLVERNEKELVLKTAEQKSVRLAPANILQMQKSSKSLMPERILSDLTAQEAADLLAYIRSLGVAK
jgi:putative heme-binding domain-containing protein